MTYLAESSTKKWRIRCKRLTTSKICTARPAMRGYMRETLKKRIPLTTWLHFVKTALITVYTCDVWQRQTVNCGRVIWSGCARAARMSYFQAIAVKDSKSSISWIHWSLVPDLTIGGAMLSERGQYRQISATWYFREIMIIVLLWLTTLIETSSKQEDARSIERTRISNHRATRLTIDSNEWDQSNQSSLIMIGLTSWWTCATCLSLISISDWMYYHLNMTEGQCAISSDHNLTA